MFIQPKALLDMDGVITNFISQIRKYYGIPDELIIPDNDYELMSLRLYLDLQANEFWSLPSNFWYEMEWTMNGHQILEAVCQVFGRENVCILTKPTDENCAHGKIKWLKKHIPWLYYKKQYLIGGAKHFTSHSRSLLIDDYEKNITAFEAEGGLGILVPQPWNKRRNMTAQFDVSEEIGEAFDRIITASVS